MHRVIRMLAIAAVCLLSFRFFTSLYYPLFNADHAVTVLMVHSFQLPGDWYFWGQDRMGSLLPMLGQFFRGGLGLSALASESLARYLVLLAGFLAFSSFLQSTRLRLVWAVAWFFPPTRMIDVVLLYGGTAFSFIAICCFLFHWYHKKKETLTTLETHLVLLAMACSAIIAAWVSDLSMISLALFFLIQCYAFFAAKGSFSAFSREPWPYYALATAIGGFLFLGAIKEMAPHRENYFILSTLPACLDSGATFLQSLKALFTFQALEPFTSVYSYLLAALALGLLFRFKTFKINTFKRSLVLFFAVDALVSFLIILCSDWTAMNGVPRRYFTGTYISLGFALLLYLDERLQQQAGSRWMAAAVLVVALTGGLGNVYHLKFISPKSLTPRVETLGELGSLGNIGIIAGYWNSYPCACPDPGRIKATPHDCTGAVRNPRLAEEVFQQDRLFVISDMWFDTFPDTMTQFQRVLLRAGDPFSLGGCTLCQYKPLPR